MSIVPTTDRTGPVVPAVRAWVTRRSISSLTLRSPAVVAASALVGYMAPPSELGLKWNPEEFGV